MAPGGQAPRVVALGLIGLPRRAIEAVKGRIDLRMPEADGIDALIGRHPEARVVITNGSTGLSSAQMARLPALGLVCAFGAGYENVDTAAATARGIHVTHAPGANDATVADHALGLMLAVARGFVPLDCASRLGTERWSAARVERPTLNGGRVGVIGLGRIGAGIATRAAAFDMQVNYHTRKPRPDVPWRYVPDVLALARDADFLIAACPGGAATRHLVNAAVLDALGPRGFLINIARGSVVDTAALADALKSGRVAGAGLDVYEGEPGLPEMLRDCPNTVITPHIAGRSPAATDAQTGMLLASLDEYLTGRTPVRVVPAA